MRKFSVIILVALITVLSGFSLADQNDKYMREVFSNGLTVIVKHNPDSRVFAVNIFGATYSLGS